MHATTICQVGDNTTNIIGSGCIIEGGLLTQVQTLAMETTPCSSITDLEGGLIA